MFSQKAHNGECFLKIGPVKGSLLLMLEFFSHCAILIRWRPVSPVLLIDFLHDAPQTMKCWLDWQTSSLFLPLVSQTGCKRIKISIMPHFQPVTSVL